jgi:hypothetical protein
VRRWLKTLLTGTTLVLLGPTYSSPVLAKTAGYCLECHSQRQMARYLQPFDHSVIVQERSVYQAKLDPCPGICSISEEIFFTESRIIRLNQILQAMEQDGRTAEILGQKVSEAAESFSYLKGSKKYSTSKFSQESSVLRASLQKVYDRTLRVRNESDRRWLIGLSSLILLGLLVLIGIGRWKLNRMGKILLILSLIGGTLSSTGCSFPPVESEKKSPAQEKLEQALQIAFQSTSKMEEGFFESILLAEMAREWSEIERAHGDRAFELAWQMALSARERAGQIRSLQQVASRWPDETEASRQKVNFNMVLDLRDELRMADSRTWALRAVAEEWVQVDRKRGRTALEFASQQASLIKDLALRDRELKSIGEAWAGIDENRALGIARSIRDPFLKAMALKDIALSTCQKERAIETLREAWKIAESMPPSYDQTKTFIQISASAAKIVPQQKNVWVEQAFIKTNSLKNPQLQAFALQEMVFQLASLDSEQAERWTSSISPLFPETRAYSFIQLANTRGLLKTKHITLLRSALAEALKIDDPFESEKIESMIVKAFVRLDPQEALRRLPQVENLSYRSEILEELALHFSVKEKNKGAELAERIPLEIFRTRTIVEIINQWMDRDLEEIDAIYREALQTTQSISDPYSKALILIDLGNHWGRLQRGKEGVPFDLALKSAGEIASLSVRAEILETLAEAWKNFDREKAKVILERMDASAGRVRRSLEEIRLWAKTDPEKARQWAEAFPPAFTLERASGLKEAAACLKKEQPALAFEILEKALTPLLTFPEGTKRSKLLSQLIAEMALVDKEKTVQRLAQIEDRELRDLLLKEAGNAWIKVDSLWAVRAAAEISESSYRFSLYQKIADKEAKIPSHSKAHEKEQPALLVLLQWGIGREKVKKDESQAIPHYEKALQETERVANLKERSYLLSGLAAERAPMSEEKALRVAEKIPSEFPEPFSFALLQVGAQLRKWNRKEAESIFQKTFSAAAQIKDPVLRAQRLLQLAQQWLFLDREKGKEVLKIGERDAQKNEKILTEILLTQADLNPGNVLELIQDIRPPVLRSKIFLESAKALSKLNIEEKRKLLENALQYSQALKNERLMGRIAAAWFALDANKAFEILNQIGSKEIRFQSLHQMAHQKSRRKQEVKKLLDLAIKEAMEMSDLKEKLKAMKEIARDWAAIDKEKAKAVYRLAYQAVEKNNLTNPKF